VREIGIYAGDTPDGFLGRYSQVKVAKIANSRVILPVASAKHLGELIPNSGISARISRTLPQPKLIKPVSLDTATSLSCAVH
jgi:hypothetical protein